MEFFGRCCQICSELEDTEALHEARVQYGIARGHQMMGNFSVSITNCSGPGLSTLIGWKDARIAPNTKAATEIQTEDHETVEYHEEVDYVATVDTGNDETSRQGSRKNSDTNDTTQVT